MCATGPQALADANALRDPDLPEDVHAGALARLTPLMRLATMLYFMSASMLVQFTTKAVFTTYGFNFPLTVALLQMTFISAWWHPISMRVPDSTSWASRRHTSPLTSAWSCRVIPRST